MIQILIMVEVRLFINGMPAIYYGLLMVILAPIAFGVTVFVILWIRRAFFAGVYAGDDGFAYAGDYTGSVFHF